MSNKTNNEKFENLLNYSTGLATEELVDKFLTDEKIEFSDSHNKKMEDLFKKVGRNDKLKRISFYSKRIAMFFLVILIISAASVMSVDAWRVKVFNMIMEITETNTEIKYEEKSNNAESYNSDEISLGYIPKGFSLTEQHATENSLSLLFSNNDYFFRLRVRKISDTKNVDTEYSDFEKIKINDIDGLINTKNGAITINWSDSDNSYSLYGNLQEQTVLEIAENIKR